MIAITLLLFFLVKTSVSSPLLPKVEFDDDLDQVNNLALGKPSDRTGEILDNWNDTAEVNPEEIGEYLEGDILYPFNNGKNGLIAPVTHWENGEIPYDYSGIFMPKDVEMIENAMKEYHRLTCIKFRKRRSDDKDFIVLTNTRTGCWSSVGKIGGRQEVNLQSPGCLSKIGTPIHELMHAAGFTHEQNRWERDEYVDILWDNIQDGRDNNFQKSTKNLTDGFGVPYDFNSVMHYSEKAFSNNGKPTIVSKTSGVTMGQRNGFSRGDVKKLRAMYNCSDDDKDINKETTNNNGVFTPGGLLSLIFG